ncbi:MAG: hypothetical protein ACD_72C00415G0006 [uncultured bacterium]|nr:MAG: hypothetical protein ACD_72C00415G0006 [uncultured bacterium]
MFVSHTAIAILSAFFAAIGTILARPLLKQIKSKEILGINFLTMTTVLLLLSPLFYFFKVTYLSVGLLMLVSLIDTVANYFYFKTFEQTDASAASPILSISPAFTFLFSWIFLQETSGIWTYFIAILIIFSTILLTADFKNFQLTKSATIIPALISTVLFGISAIPAKYLLNNLQAINSPTLYMFRAGIISLFALLLFGFNITTISIKQYRLIFVRSLFVIAQYVLFYYAISSGNTGVSSTLANITPFFVFILAAVFLKEKITLKKATAAVFIIFLSLII